MKQRIIKSRILTTIFALTIMLVSCSKETPHEPEPNELTLIGYWNLNQHIWSNGIESDSACVDMLLHLELINIVLYEWDSFSFKFVEKGGPEQSYYSYSYPTPYGPAENVNTIDWDTLQADTLCIGDGYTNPKFRYSLYLEGKIPILRLEDNAGTWIFN